MYMEEVYFRYATPPPLWRHHRFRIAVGKTHRDVAKKCNNNYIYLQNVLSFALSEKDSDISDTTHRGEVVTDKEIYRVWGEDAMHLSRHSNYLLIQGSVDSMFRCSMFRCSMKNTLDSMVLTISKERIKS